MNRFLKFHPQAILIIIALFLIACIIGYFFWGIVGVFESVNQALWFSPQSRSVGFDLSTAAKLNLRGLGPAAQQASPATTTP